MRVSVFEILRDNLLYSHSVFSIEQVVFAVALWVHIVSSNVASNFRIFISQFQLISFGISLIFQINRIVSKPIAVCSSSNSEILPFYILLFTTLYFSIIVVNFLPSTIFPLQLLDSFSLNILLFFWFFLISFHFIIYGEVLLESFQCIDVMCWGLLRGQKISCTSAHTHSVGELTWLLHWLLVIVHHFAILFLLFQESNKLNL